MTQRRLNELRKPGQASDAGVMLVPLTQIFVKALVNISKDKAEEEGNRNG